MKESLTNLKISQKLLFLSLVATASLILCWVVFCAGLAGQKSVSDSV